MTEARLAHVMIYAKQIERLTAFYQSVFDLSPEPPIDSRWVVLKAKAGAGIALHALPADVSNSNKIGSPAQWREETACKVCFEVPDLIAHRQRILDHGGQAKEPWDWEGTRFCECADPEGNVVQIFMPIQGLLPELVE